ncbi:MAG: glycosyltransferase family A protein [Nanoarchaeota archaeon]
MGRTSPRGKSMPLVSIVMPVYNSAATLKESLEAIFRSDYPSYELIVVDDASSDDSVKIARSFPCKIIEKKKNTGAGDTRNIGAKAAKGQILLFTDSDCIMKKDTLSKLVKSFAKAVDVVAGTYSKKTLRGSSIYESYHSLLCHYNYSRSDVALFGTFCAAIKRETFEKLGGFDKSIGGATVEDLKFQYGLQKRHIPYVISMDAQVFHKSRATFSSLIRGYYTRARYAAGLLFTLKRIKPEKSGYILNHETIASYGFVSLAALFLLLSFFKLSFILPLILSLMAFIMSRRKLYQSAPKNVPLLKIIGISMVCDLAVVVGGAIGTVQHSIKGGKRR